MSGAGIDVVFWMHCVMTLLSAISLRMHLNLVASVFVRCCTVTFINFNFMDQWFTANSCDFINFMIMNRLIVKVMQLHSRQIVFPAKTGNFHRRAAVDTTTRFWFQCSNPELKICLLFKVHDFLLLLFNAEADLMLQIIPKALWADRTLYDCRSGL